MAVIQRHSTQKFVQQAYRNARYGEHPKAKPYVKPVPQNSFPHAIPNSAQTSNSIGNSAPNPSVVPYDHASKRRVAMALVDLCTAYIEGLWPQPQNSRIPLRTFVFEILRRSRVQYPVFQVALCYMARLRPVIKSYLDLNQALPEKLACGRRLLIVALQVASKFLQDRCYSASVWAKISGLPVEDIKRNELAFMEALDWKLFVSYEAYMRSCQRLRVTVDTAFLERAGKPPQSPVMTTSVPNSAMPTPESSPVLVPVPLEKSPEVEIWNQF